MGTYDVAQICLNGHVINDSHIRDPEFSQQYCSECGAKTIIQCPHCQKAIRGRYHAEGALIPGDDKPAPSYCDKCGAPYPWTEAKLQAAGELIELADMTTEQKESLKADLPAIITDNPRTSVAATKVKILLGKAGKELSSGLRDIVVDIASEAAKKIIFGP